MLFDLRISPLSLSLSGAKILPHQPTNRNPHTLNSKTGFPRLFAIPNQYLRYPSKEKVIEELDVYCCCEKLNCDLEESTRSSSCCIHASLINGNQESWGQAIAKAAFPQILQIPFFDHVTFKWLVVWQWFFVYTKFDAFLIFELYINQPTPQDPYSHPNNSYMGIK